MDSGQVVLDRVREACQLPHINGASCLEAVYPLFGGMSMSLGILGYAWFSILYVVNYLVVRACCGRQKKVDTGTAYKWTMGYFWKTLIFVNIVIAPKDLKEWTFWYLWFSSVGELRLLTNVARLHFENVVDNPRFGAVQTLRALALHALVLFMCAQLAWLGWAEFYEWGQGPLGQILLSSHPDAAEASAGDASGAVAGQELSRTAPERGGAGFTFVLLYDLVVLSSEALLSAFKYLANLVEMYRGTDAPETGEEGLLEQMAFFLRLGLALASGARTLHVFRACSHCVFLRKCVVRLLSIFNGAFALEEIHRAASKVVLARDIDVAFKSATKKEMREMAKDEACPICLKAMLSAKKLECNHFFHGKCLQQYLDSAGDKPLCPICRAPVSWNPAIIKEKREGARASSGGVRGTRRGVVENGTTGTAAGTGALDARQDRPGIFTGSAPRPDRFTRGARGAYAAARLVHNIARAWRNEFNVARAAAAAALAEEEANEHARDRQRRNQLAVVRAAATAAAAAEAEARLLASENIVPPRGGHGGVSGAGGVQPAVEDVAALTEVAITAEVVEREGARDGEGLSGAPAGEVQQGELTAADVRIIVASAERLVEIFPDMSMDRAIWRARQARGSVRRVPVDASGGYAGEGGGTSSEETPAALSSRGAASATGGDHDWSSQEER